VLLDAPCTGTGTFRRHPDGRWRVTADDLAALAALQAELLEAAAPLVRPGGVLVYSTCSLEREENEERVEAFLAEHPDFAVEPAPGAVPAPLLDAAGFLCVLPQRQGVDGAFAARLRRRG
jgi:16S rRNA (cytosine967-C5)-methyltransferase